MFENKNYIRRFAELMTEGFIFIDDQGKIQVYNEKAKEIFGIRYGQGIGHDEGKINNGDIVIIGDNCLGKDDGGLTPKDLTYIGIDDGQIALKDVFIGIGVYKSKKITPVYKNQKFYEKADTFTLNTVFKNISIHIQINFFMRSIDISIEKQSFKMNYINDIGHMLVIDGITKKVKFYQAEGYTARGEGIGNLLLGKSFRAKGKDVEQLDVLGKDLFEIHEQGDTINEFYKVAKGMNISYKDKFTQINGYPTLCTLVPVSIDSKIAGAALKVEDLSMLKKVMKERDEALFQIEQMQRMLKEDKNIKDLFSQILGESDEINNVKRMAYKASKSNSTVLLLGESGTGKSIFAKAIHKASRYKDKPFIHVNCGAISEHLLESELFGYEKGAFTGASTKGKVGLFEAASGGTIFLDEIGEIKPFIQVKLLKVLQSKTFFRVGGTKEISVDVRVIVATNKNLEEEMHEGRFREDLYYRINVFPIWIPPLRERKQDIYFLVHAIIPKICNRMELREKSISGEAMYRLMEYDWPGNIRELENILERAVNISEGNMIHEFSLSLKSKTQEIEKDENKIMPLKEYVRNAEEKAIKEALKYYLNDKMKVMEALKIGKTSFYEKIKKYKIK